MLQDKIMHEVGHAVGLWHEQSRQDRDNFVIVDLCYVQAGKEHNFNKEDSNAVGDYDSLSLMHYASSAFQTSLRTDKPQCAGKPASGWPLLRLDGTQIQPSNAPTAGDVHGIATLYGDTSRNDFNGHGKVDILWHNGVSGDTHVWYIDGIRRLDGQSV